MEGLTLLSVAACNVSSTSRKGGSCHRIRLWFSAFSALHTDVSVHFGLFGFCILENLAAPLIYTLGIDIILQN